MRRTSSTGQTPAVLSGLLVALLVLFVEVAAWSVLGALFRPHFAPELGPLVGFLVFAVLLAAYFVPLFLLVGCPFLWLARMAPLRWRWPISALTALLVAGAVSLVSTGLDDRRSDTVIIAALSLLPTATGASVVLRRWNLSRSPTDQQK
jgi:hypothetical protein